MNAKKFYLLIGIVFVIGLWPQKNVSADVGPKPSMDFEFVQSLPGEKLTIVSGTLYQCNLSDCSDAEPVIEKGIRGAWGFGCDQQTCQAQEWGGTYYQLEVIFSDGKTRKSNIFGHPYYNTQYKVAIQEDSLLVEVVGGYDNRRLFYDLMGKLITISLVVIGVIILWPVIIFVPVMVIQKARGKPYTQAGSCMLMVYLVYFTVWGLLQDWRSFLLTLWIEIGIAFAFLIILSGEQKKKSVLVAVAIANIFTQPVFFLAISRINGTTTSIIIGEVIVWLVETTIIYVFQQKQLSFKHILLMTLAMNIISAGIGLLL